MMRIPCYMFDCAARFRPAAFFDIAQQLAAEGAERLGFSDKDLDPRDMVWILARMKVRFDKLPARGDSIMTRTWHRGMSGLFFYRDYELSYPDGTLAAASSSSWVIMEKSSRKLVRPEATVGIVPESPELNERALDCDAGKLVVPMKAKLEKIGEHKVVYSDLDYNGHVNNAKYVVWSLDALPIEITGKQEIKEISINFNREAIIGNTVELFHVESNGKHFVEGILPEGQSFIFTAIY